MKNHTWTTLRSGNPNKAWVVDGEGRKLSALMTYTTALGITTSHNLSIIQLEQHYDQNLPNPETTS